MKDDNGIQRFNVISKEIRKLTQYLDNIFQNESTSHYEK